MAATDDYDDEDTGVRAPLTLRLKETFWPAAVPKLGEDGMPDRFPDEERRAVMKSLDPQEVKLSFGAFLLATIAGIAIPAYIIGSNKVTKAGKNTIAVAPDAKLLGGLILVLCVLGFVTLWKRKRTFVAFDLFLIGFAFTLFIGLIAFVFILLGGWLMLRAWRINRYGTTDAKAIRQEVASRPRGKGKGGAAPASKTAGPTKGRASSQPASRKPPTASKRYTPKAPPRKKIPKPTE
ncbi:MAG TPA: tetraspanin family protein [Acidimicrobiales bacterium]|jgi:hypothetical protein|nr:tetraspanin family protein [Acidimicrobiales bacterium]